MKKIAFYAIYLLLSFLFIEGCLRVYEYFYPLPFVFSSGNSRFRGVPNADFFGYTLNSQGFKDQLFKPKEKDTYRILGLGDSFTFSVTPYPYNFLTIAEETLQSTAEKKGKPIEIYNMGISSTGPPDQLDLLMKEGVYWEPDLVLINFFVGNDFQDSMRSGKKKLLQTYSYTATLLYTFYKLMTQTSQGLRDQYLAGLQVYCDTCKTIAKNEYTELQAARSFIFNTNDKEFEPALSDALYYLEKIKKVCSARGIGFVVAILPDESQVNLALQNEVIQYLANGAEKITWDNTRPNRRLAEELEKSGIGYIDLLPIFIAHRDSVCYVPQDTHWNICGNHLAGKYLSGELVKFVRTGK